MITSSHSFFIFLVLGIDYSMLTRLGKGNDYPWV